MKDLLAKIRQIHHQCEQRGGVCSGCVFYDGNYHCQVKEVTYELCRSPREWNMEKIEKAIK